jgi:hypothetical protein
MNLEEQARKLRQDLANQVRDAARRDRDSRDAAEFTRTVGRQLGLAPEEFGAMLRGDDAKHLRLARASVPVSPPANGRHAFERVLSAPAQQIVFDGRQGPPDGFDVAEETPLLDHLADFRRRKDISRCRAARRANVFGLDLVPPQGTPPDVWAEVVELERQAAIERGQEVEAAELQGLPDWLEADELRHVRAGVSEGEWKALRRVADRVVKGDETAGAEAERTYVVRFATTDPRGQPCFGYRVSYYDPSTGGRPDPEELGRGAAVRSVAELIDVGFAKRKAIAMGHMPERDVDDAAGPGSPWNPIV